MDKVVINLLKQQGIEELKPFADKDGIYAYKKEGKINFCDSELNSVTRKDLELRDGVLFIVQQNDKYKFVSKDDEYENIIEIDSKLNYKQIGNNFAFWQYFGICFLVQLTLTPPLFFCDIPVSNHIFMSKKKHSFAFPS